MTDGGGQSVVGSVRVCLCVILLTGLTAAALAVPATGRESAQEVKRGAGRTVWDGIYTEQQATRGRTEYAQSCASCHADDLRGRSTAPSLVEESFAFLWGEMTVGDLFERIRTRMPPDRPNSLSSQSYVDIIAFILQKNEFPPAERELTGEADALRQILITTKRR